MRRWAMVVALLLALTTLSACGRAKEDDRLISWYGAEKAGELGVACTDEAQLAVAEELAEKARALLLHAEPMGEAELSACGELSRYYELDPDADHADAACRVLTTKQEGGAGYVWVSYSATYYSRSGEVRRGFSERISRWDIQQRDGQWVVTGIDEMP